MANKRKLHHLYTKLRIISPAALAGLFLMASFVTIIALRNNNLQMIRLREQVFTADEKGDHVEQALDNLRAFVYSHMNTNLNSGGLSIKPPIQLKYTYDRLVSAEKQRVSAKTTAIAADATKYCEAHHPAGHIQERAKCVQQYISDRPVAEQTVPKELYQFDFVSPIWSPDVAGFSLLLSIVLLLLFLSRVLLGLWFKHELH